jgi:hypothetical protein
MPSFAHLEQTINDRIDEVMKEDLAEECFNVQFK